jgi:hypothetical protein
MESHDTDTSQRRRSPRWEVYEIVAELIEQHADAPPSRNRHFDAWQDKTRGAAYRLYSRLLDIKGDLEQLRRDGGTPQALRGSDGDIQLTYELQQVPQGPVTRRAELNHTEWELLAAVCGPLTPEVARS